MNVDFESNTDPFAKGHWRWEQIKDCVALAKKKRPKVIISDPFAANLVNELKSRKKIHDPDVNLARRIFEVDGLLRAEIEARILAGQSDDLIASKTGLTPKIIQHYEWLFFDVRKYLGAIDWLLTSIVGSKHLWGFRDGDLRQLWCYSAISGGSVIVEELIRLFELNRKVNDRECLSVYLRKRSQMPIEMQTHIAFLAIPRSELGGIWRVDLNARMRGVALLNTEEKRMQAVQRIMTDTIMVGRKSLRGKKLPAPKPWPKRNAETSNTPGRSVVVDHAGDLDHVITHCAASGGIVSLSSVPT